MALTTLLVVGAVVALAAFALVSLAPRGAQLILTGRQVLFGILSVVGAILLIQTGATEAIALGALVLFFVFLWYFTADDDDVPW